MHDTNKTSAKWNLIAFASYQRADKHLNQQDAFCGTVVYSVPCLAVCQDFLKLSACEILGGYPAKPASAPLAVSCQAYKI